MNREILFRGKCEKDGNWNYGHLFQRDDGTMCILESYVTLKKSIYYELDQDTICQYTGVCDKCGNKIFEKDIVSASFIGYAVKQKIRKGVVEFINGAFSVNWIDSEEYGKNFVGYVNNIEVIGNIFENPELLQSN